MDNSNIPKGSGQLETPISGKPINQSGVYEHPGSKAQVIAMPDGKSTGVQDALVRMGYVRVAPAPSRVELQAIRDKQLKVDQEKEAKGLPTGVPGEPPAVRYNGTVTPKLEDVVATANAAEERAKKAEAELKKLQETQGTIDPQVLTDAQNRAGTAETRAVEAEARAKAAEDALASVKTETTPPDGEQNSGDGSGDQTSTDQTQTNENKGK